MFYFKSSFLYETPLIISRNNYQWKENSTRCMQRKVSSQVKLQYFQSHQKPWLLEGSINDGTEKLTLPVFHAEEN